MKKTTVLLPLLALALFPVVAARIKPPKAVKVEVRQANGRYELLRAGRPYFVRGAGGSKFPERIAAYGGNSIRTWGTGDAAKVLGTARANGLTVMLGLDVARERHGFNYNDPQTAAQFQKIKAGVLKYKDDPAVLLWGIGNELNLEYQNPRVWDAVNDIARMIHEVDPNPPAPCWPASSSGKSRSLRPGARPSTSCQSTPTRAWRPSRSRCATAAGPAPTW